MIDLRTKQRLAEIIKLADNGARGRDIADKLRELVKEPELAEGEWLVEVHVPHAAFELTSNQLTMTSGGDGVLINRAAFKTAAIPHIRKLLDQLEELEVE